MSEETVAGNGVSEKMYHTTINGKRPPESSHMEVDGDDSTPHQAIKRPKTDINGFDYPMIATTDKQSAGDLCNGQLPDVNHDKLNHLSVEVEQRRDRLSQSPSPRLTQSDKPVVGSPRNNGGGVGEVKELVNSRDRDALVSNEDRRSNVESEPEVITLSDSEDELREVLSHSRKLSLCNPKTLKMLRRHQQKLRLEESTLFLLKKLRESMSIQHRPSAADLSTKSETRNVAGQLMSNQKSGGSGGNVPPPLKRGLHQSPGHHSTPPNKVPNHHGVSQQSLSSINHSAKQLSSHNSHSSSGHGSSGPPPPLVNMAKTPVNQSNGSALSYSQSTPAVKKPAPPPQPPQLTAEQKLSAAKLALKKQLEQSLQQIPTPKPPPPEVNFLPSLASGEFVYLLGMEEVVKHILSKENKDSKYVVNPFTCVQCSTDFTPVWKRDKPGSKNVICERCISTKQKKSMRKEHTAKLKATFTKALQKEREIERRINAGSPLSDIPGLNAYAAANTIREQQQQQHRTTQSSNPSPAPNTPNMPQLTPQQSSASSSAHLAGASATSSSQLTATAAHLQQQALIQAQAAEQMRAMLAAQAMALPYQLYGVSNNKQVAELQRQYLLDMINPARSWKT